MFKITNMKLMRIFLSFPTDLADSDLFSGMYVRLLVKCRPDVYFREYLMLLEKCWPDWYFCSVLTADSNVVARFVFT